MVVTPKLGQCLGASEPSRSGDAVELGEARGAGRELSAGLEESVGQCPWWEMANGRADRQGADLTF